jgi:hypothetical protein
LRLLLSALVGEAALQLRRPLLSGPVHWKWD